MSSRAMLRASDADRDAAAERLRTAAAEGRLDTEELDERLDVALRARTYGELDRVLIDLPSSVPARRRSTQVASVAQSAFSVALPILTTLAVVAAVVVVAAVAAAWWILWGLVWFFMCGRGACMPRRSHAHGMRRTRPAGLH